MECYLVQHIYMFSIKTGSDQRTLILSSLMNTADQDLTQPPRPTEASLARGYTVPRVFLFIFAAR